MATLDRMMDLMIGCDCRSVELGPKQHPRKKELSRKNAHVLIKDDDKYLLLR